MRAVEAWHLLVLKWAFANRPLSDALQLLQAGWDIQQPVLLVGVCKQNQTKAYPVPDMELGMAAEP